MNLFGTDGIRGKYGETLTDETAYALGAALIQIEGSGVIVVGKDTRLSGTTITEALIKGINDFGGQVINMGIVPTNAVSHFVRKADALFGVMVTASHNPPEYNGLKVFDRYGIKICETKQIELSRHIQKKAIKISQFKTSTPVFLSGNNVYVKDVCDMLNFSLRGTKIALDCCYGSAYEVAKKVFSCVEAEVVAYCDFNRGEQINLNCGATNPEFLQSMMKTNECDLGFAFDGDADRLAVLEKDVLLSPDRILFAFAKYLKNKKLLNHNAVVGTIMTDTGLENSLAKIGIKLFRTDVGDAQIYKFMTENRLNLGGENSGHYLLSDYACGSDALINALFVSKIYLEEGSLLNYTKEYKPYKNKSKNISVEEGTIEKFKNAKILEKIQNSFTKRFSSARLIARFSGTEPKIRIYVEGKNIAVVSLGLDYVLKEIENAIMHLNV